MLKSNNFDSIVGDLSAFSSTPSVDATTLQLAALEPIPQFEQSVVSITSNKNNNNNYTNNGSARGSAETTTKPLPTSETSLAALQLTSGVLQSYAPPIAKAKTQLKELIQKQNKIYIDLSAEKFKLDNADVAKLQDMMNNVKVCREKLLKIKKNMQNIYQRSQVLKKRAINIQMCKEKELQRKIQKQQQEESLIGKQPQ
ncbi:hypothetical protein DOY81_004707 [Sarcophaga bullata]|nr:hypothetical protein DOY81_004707 [Sarcophaga bullata]